jgi:hypothetical protein
LAAVIILRNSSSCDQYQVGLATRLRLRIYLFVGLELGPVVVLAVAVA